MNRTTGITIASLAIIAAAGGAVAFNQISVPAASELPTKPIEVAQAAAPAAPAAAEASEEPASTLDKSSDEAPEITQVTGQLVKADGGKVSNGVVYFVFQSRLNEIPHDNPFEKVKAMAEVGAVVDAEGTFTLKMKPGNFAMVYDPAATEAPTQPGAESMTALKKLTSEQVQARIAAIKENASKGLPIASGKLGEAFVVENRFVRPPVSDFGQITLQNPGVVTIKATDDNGELINFPASLRLRGKNGDIMEPHTPSVSKRAEYEFHDILPQSYQVYALGTLPAPGAGDSITTPSIENDQLIFTGETLVHEAIVKPQAN